MFSHWPRRRCLCSAKQTLLEILVKGHKGKEMLFKGSSTFSSGNDFVQQSRTILAILVKRQKRNICLKLFEIGPLAAEQTMFKGVFFQFWLWQPFCSAKRNHFSFFGKGL